MNLNRAIEILNSQQEIDVHYHGVPVWIESIEENSNTAKISARGTHDYSRVVTIDALEEN